MEYNLLVLVDSQTATAPTITFHTIGQHKHYGPTVSALAV